MMKWINRIVIPRIAPHWEEVAYELLIPDESIETFKSDSKGNTKGCCLKMFKAWIHSRVGALPKTWEKLMMAISNVEELQRATEQIKDELTSNCDEICSDLALNCMSFKNT